VETPDGLVLVDGGLPGHLPRFRSRLEGIGRSLGDIRAVLLTHAHPDHTGVVAAVRRAGADVWVDERDAAALAGARAAGTGWPGPSARCSRTSSAVPRRCA
jgi:glyoxylase-like metal-dependent hydrolase (beta-lactamase superfamily II)